MLSEPFIKERKIGVDQIDHAAVLLRDGLKQHLSLGDHRLAGARIKLENVFASGVTKSIIRNEPLADRLSTSAPRFRILQHPLYLRASSLAKFCVLHGAAPHQACLQRK